MRLEACMREGDRRNAAVFTEDKAVQRPGMTLSYLAAPILNIFVPQVEHTP